MATVQEAFEALIKDKRDQVKQDRADALQITEQKRAMANDKQRNAMDAFNQAFQTAQLAQQGKDAETGHKHRGAVLDETIRSNKENEAFNRLKLSDNQNADALKAAKMAKDDQAKLDKETFNQLDKLGKTPQFKAVDATMHVKDLLTDYRQLIDEYGLNPVGKGRALAESKYNSLVLKIKELEKLGALTGPDLDILNKLVPKITGYWNAKKRNILGGGIRGIKASLNDIDSSLDRLVDRNKASLGSLYGIDPDSIFPQKGGAAAASKNTGKRSNYVDFSQDEEAELKRLEEMGLD